MKLVVQLMPVALLACCSPSSGSPADAQGNPPPESVARELLQDMFIDSGALSLAASNGFEASGADIWAGWSSDPGFASIADSRRQAIRSHLQSEYPRDATDIVLRSAPQALDAASPRLAALLTIEEMDQIASFLRSEVGRSCFVTTVQSGDANYEPTAAEAAVVGVGWQGLDARSQ